MSDVMHEVFLPYTADELLPHFVHYDPEGERPERFLTKWRKRIADASSKDPAWLERDETLWTANALMAMQRKADCADRSKAIMAKPIGPVPPTTERLDWSDLLPPDLELFFEVHLPSPLPYRCWLSHHLGDRQVHLIREYAGDPSAIQRDLPHLDGLTCAALSRRVGWLTFEDLGWAWPTVCPRLTPGETTPQADDNA
jgi:hypothetical protein